MAESTSVGLRKEKDNVKKFLNYQVTGTVSGSNPGEEDGLTQALPGQRKRE